MSNTVNLSDLELATARLITQQVAESTRLTEQHMTEQRLMQSRQRLEQTNLEVTDTFRVYPPDSYITNHWVQRLTQSG